MKIAKHSIAIILSSFVIAGSSLAQNIDQPLPSDVLRLEKTAGKPLRLYFKDGRVAGMRVRTLLTSLESTLTLSENSCSAQIGNRIGYEAPMVFKSLIAYWVEHPTRKGQAIARQSTNRTTGEVTTETLNATTFFASMNDKKIAEKINGDISMKRPELAPLTLANLNSFAWLTCKNAQECQDLIPEQKNIMFWDENFEFGNAEILMSSDFNTPSVNQVTTRLQNTPVVAKDSKLFLNLPEKAYGILVNFYPPGVTYQVQWTLQQKNLGDSDDDLCKMIWNMDFTRIFNEVTREIERVRLAKNFDLKDSKDYNFDPAEEAIPQLSYFIRDFQNIGDREMEQQ